MSETIDIDGIGRLMGERLQALADERAAVAQATAHREEAVAAEDAARQRYVEKVEEVRAEGYVADVLLEKSGHPIGKRRGRPANKTAGGAAAPAKR